MSGGERTHPSIPSEGASKPQAMSSDQSIPVPISVARKASSTGSKTKTRTKGKTKQPRSEGRSGGSWRKSLRRIFGMGGGGGEGGAGPGQGPDGDQADSKTRVGGKKRRGSGGHGASRVGEGGSVQQHSGESINGGSMGGSNTVCSDYSNEYYSSEYYYNVDFGSNTSGGNDAERENSNDLKRRKSSTIHFERLRLSDSSAASDGNATTSQQQSGSGNDIQINISYPDGSVATLSDEVQSGSGNRSTERKGGTKANNSSFGAGKGKRGASSSSSPSVLLSRKGNQGSNAIRDEDESLLHIDSNEESSMSEGSDDDTGAVDKEDARDWLNMAGFAALVDYSDEEQIIPENVLKGPKQYLTSNEFGTLKKRVDSLNKFVAHRKALSLTDAQGMKNTKKGQEKDLSVGRSGRVLGKTASERRQQGKTQSLDRSAEKTVEEAKSFVDSYSTVEGKEDKTDNDYNEYKNTEKHSWRRSLINDRAMLPLQDRVVLQQSLIQNIEADEAITQVETPSIMRNSGEGKWMKEEDEKVLRCISLAETAELGSISRYMGETDNSNVSERSGEYAQVGAGVDFGKGKSERRMSGKGGSGRGNVGFERAGNLPKKTAISTPHGDLSNRPQRSGLQGKVEFLRLKSDVAAHMRSISLIELTSLLETHVDFFPVCTRSRKSLFKRFRSRLTSLGKKQSFGISEGGPLGPGGGASMANQVRGGDTTCTEQSLGCVEDGGGKNAVFGTELPELVERDKLLLGSFLDMCLLGGCDMDKIMTSKHFQQQQNDRNSCTKEVFIFLRELMNRDFASRGAFAQANRDLGTEELRVKYFCSYYLRNSQQTPLVLVGLLYHGLLVDGHQNAEGIFRRPGPIVRVKELKESIDRKGVFDFKELVAMHNLNSSPHILASVVKMFLSELPQPLLTETYCLVFTEIQNVPEPIRLTCLQLLVLLLPTSHMSTLKTILEALFIISRADNKMDARNLAIVLMPTLYFGRHVDELKIKRLQSPKKVAALDDTALGDTRNSPCSPNSNLRGGEDGDSRSLGSPQSKSLTSLENGSSFDRKKRKSPAPNSPKKLKDVLYDPKFTSNCVATLEMMIENYHQLFIVPKIVLDKWNRIKSFSGKG
eukprot:Nk52_evm15s328 gene=Nk52_evmTU15s328